MSDQKIGLCFGAFFLALVSLIIWVASEGVSEQRAWIESCVADGNKRYECEERYARAHQSHSTVAVPVVVPVRL